jgi:hypothetical protein
VKDATIIEELRMQHALNANQAPLSETLKQLVLDGVGWEKRSDLVCKNYGHAAYAEKDGGHRMCCPECGFVSFNPTQDFKSKTAP